MGSPLKAETRVQIPFAPVAKANSSAKTAEASIVAGESDSPWFHFGSNSPEFSRGIADAVDHHPSESRALAPS